MGSRLLLPQSMLVKGLVTGWLFLSQDVQSIGHQTCAAESSLGMGSTFSVKLEERILCSLDQGSPLS